jgi:Tfp pilus assembly protein FimT
MRQARNTGFSALELLMVLAIGLVIVVLAIPSLTETLALYRVSADAKLLAQDLIVAKMRAGTNFTQERLNANTASNTYQLEQYNKSGLAWGPDGDTKYLSSGVSFGFGSISTPAGSQSSIAQSTLITFNSRGIPVNGSNQATPEDALYIRNATGYYAISVALSGRVQVWKYVNSGWVGQ